MTEKNLYWYKAKVVSVYDGDTITVDISLGMRITMCETIRLYGINTPEVRGPQKPEGLVSRAWLRDQLKNCMVDEEDYLMIHTLKDKSGKYGRLLAELWIGDRCLNTEMVELGLAVKYMV